ncbi:hypothetical protein C8R45DRAFT_1100770 [Mycena sanguinolenta]|nr:hypothetical protein C8R45DRAFT_1100770 [Mycena sanguinolenta]
MPVICRSSQWDDPWNFVPWHSPRSSFGEWHVHTTIQESGPFSRWITSSPSYSLPRRIRFPLALDMSTSSSFTALQIAHWLSPSGYNGTMSHAQLDQLLSDYTDDQLDEVLDEMGLTQLASRLPPILSRLVLTAERAANHTTDKDDIATASTVSSEDDDNLEVFDISEESHPHAAPTAPAAPAPAASAPALLVFDVDDVPTPPSSPSLEPRQLPQTPVQPRATAPAPAAPAAPTPTAPVPAAPAAPTPTAPAVPAAPVAPTAPAVPAALIAPAAPVTPHSARSYVVDSPAKTGCVASWFEAGSLTVGVPGASVHGVGRSRRTRKGPAAAYVVFFGRQVGVFTEWADAHRSTTGNGVAIHAGYPSLAAANAALEFARTKGWTADSSPSVDSNSPLPLPSSYDENPLNSGNTSNLWYVMCRGLVPGIYRSWLECSLNTSGVKGNLCNTFHSRAEAEQAFSEAVRSRYTCTLTR